LGHARSESLRMNIPKIVFEEITGGFQTGSQIKRVIPIDRPGEAYPSCLKPFYQWTRFDFQLIDPEVNRKGLPERLLKTGKIRNDLFVAIKWFV
jgi:hypothetical protein